MSNHNKILAISRNLAFARQRRREQDAEQELKRAKAAANPENWGINQDVIAQAVKRGEKLDVKKGKPVQRSYSGGLFLLFSHGKITQQQADMGKLYGDCYQQSLGLIKSQLETHVHSNHRTFYGIGAEARLAAVALQPYKIALQYDAHLIYLCNKVCGEGYRIRDLAINHITGQVDRTRAKALEQSLIEALDRMIRHFAPSQ